MRAADAQRRVERRRAIRRRPRFAGTPPSPLGGEEAAAAGAALAHEGEPSIGVGVRIDQHVLQQVAERRFDGALVARLDLEVIGHGARG